jgi:hypothetical protein
LFDIIFFRKILSLWFFSISFLSSYAGLMTRAIGFASSRVGSPFIT